MSSVFERYRDRFTQSSRLQEQQRQAAEDERQKDQEEIRDMRAFVNTGAYKKLRSRLNQMLKDATPQVGMGVEGAAGCAFRQAGILEVVSVLDQMVRRAEGKIDG